MRDITIFILTFGESQSRCVRKFWRFGVPSLTSIAPLTTFPDIGGALYGPWMRYAILSSITISQIGFVAAYTIFVSQNLQASLLYPFEVLSGTDHNYFGQAFVMAVTNCLRLISVQYFILMQLVIFLPLALIRNLAKLSTTALVADVFILAGLIYIFGSEVAVIAKNGPAEVRLFNPKDFPLFIGSVEYINFLLGLLIEFILLRTAVFSFEGVGLVSVVYFFSLGALPDICFFIGHSNHRLHARTSQVSSSSFGRHATSPGCLRRCRCPILPCFWFGYPNRCHRQP